MYQEGISRLNLICLTSVTLKGGDDVGTIIIGNFIAKFRVQLVPRMMLRGVGGDQSLISLSMTLSLLKLIQLLPSIAK